VSAPVYRLLRHDAEHKKRDEFYNDKSKRWYETKVPWITNRFPFHYRRRCTYREAALARKLGIV
jgi:hypothetical protein